MNKNSLKDILNKNIDDHKSEIEYFTKVFVKNKQSVNNGSGNPKWQSSKKSKHILPESNATTKEKPDEFSDRLFNFVLGGDEISDKKSTRGKRKEQLKLKALDSSCQLNELKIKPIQHRSIGKVTDEDFVDISLRSPERFSFTSPRYATRASIQQPQQQEILPHYIHPRYQTRYDELLRFRTENIRESDDVEQNILTGTSLVRHLEERLKTRLESLEKSGRTPNFIRLQIFSDIFNDLISDSWLLAPLLTRIKFAYDEEVDSALAKPIIHKNILEEEVEQLKQSVYDKSELKILQTEVNQLNDAITICLQTEREYDDILKFEEGQLNSLIKRKDEADELKRQKFKPNSTTVLVPSESEKLEILKGKCWDIMDELSEIHKRTKYSMVSVATINHLKDGLQDVGIELEKINYHKEQLLTETDEMMKELSEFLSDSDISTHNSELISSVLSTVPSGRMEFSEESKWNWYIS